jgi:N utilization substance protein B
MQSLYWTESSGDPIAQTARTMCLRAGLTDEATGFAIRLAQETWENGEAADRLISGASENWAIERMSRVDKILLRMALTEIDLFDDIPQTVSIDEAIELSKRYSVEKAPAFINGILDAIVKVRKETPGGEGELTQARSSTE